MTLLLAFKQLHSSILDNVAYLSLQEISVLLDPRITQPTLFTKENLDNFNNNNNKAKLIETCQRLSMLTEYGIKQHQLAKQVFQHLHDAEKLKVIGQTIHNTFAKDNNGSLFFMKVIYNAVMIVVRLFGDNKVYTDIASKNIRSSWNGVGEWSNK